MTLKCASCGVIYQHRQSLSRHMKTFHPTLIVPSVSTAFASLLCTVCGDESKNRFKCKRDFIEHLSAVHDVPDSDSTVTKVFDSLEAFRAWKIEIERETGAFYVVARTHKNEDNKILTYECNRSGYYTPKGNGMQHLKTKTSKKMDGYCPSDLKVKVGKYGKCTVTHFKRHWGHAMELQHLSSKADERKRVRNNVLLKKKQELAALCKNVVTLIENSTSIREVEVASELVTSIPHAMAAVRESCRKPQQEEN